ncbi:response regulator [Thermoflavimicrobium dichotomicum]|uniref:Transcriptional regulatory protein n=1 Tax=Thermoflavimicrobium dichotomicum TaxID=46223 RepID=A0A1I3Q6T9_9BACL|nr:response regulator [Thermoflavimicrobium dichotomicum]SFJ29379.1 two-component system, CitB family, response regulator [Thermoflavimicrobium dichotomicum]
MIDVLIVEDDIRVAEINRRFVEKIEGYRVVGVANTGEEAKEYLEVMQPQLVLLDVYLPDMKGVELVWHIRQRYKHTDIIMITAGGEIETVQESIRGGVFDYLVKPVLFERFKRSMEKYRQYLTTLSKHHQLDQKLLDQILWSKEEITETPYGPSLPKGIDPITLEKVVQIVSDYETQGITAEQVGVQMGASRTTARRYLEYLVSIKRLKADLSYGSIGRPERRYYPMTSL